MFTVASFQRTINSFLLVSFACVNVTSVTRYTFLQDSLFGDLESPPSGGSSTPAASTNVVVSPKKGKKKDGQSKDAGKDDPKNK
jgi:hypothetical protein